jgi:heptosyltransferase-2
VWLQTAFIGDIVLTSAAIDLVHRLHPDIHQWVITTPVGKEVLADCPGLKGVVVWEKRAGKALGGFAGVKKQLAGLSSAGTVLLQVHPSIRSSLLARYLGFPTIAYRESSGSWLADQRVSKISVLHEAHRIGLLLEPLGFSREQILASRPTLPRQAEREKPGLALSMIGELKRQGKRLVAVAPSSVWGTKRWLPAYFSALVAELCRDPELQVVFLGSKHEGPLIAEIIAGIPREGGAEGWHNLAGATSIAELKSIFPEFSLVISGDSSPVHFASAYNVPTVAIFGATVSAMGFGPLADRQRVVEHPSLPCRPCSDHGPQTCPLTHFRCMRELSVAEVYRACRELLS